MIIQVLKEYSSRTEYKVLQKYAQIQENGIDNIAKGVLLLPGILLSRLEKTEIEMLRNWISVPSNQLIITPALIECNIREIFDTSIDLIILKEEGLNYEGIQCEYKIESKPQERVLDVAIRYWIAKYKNPPRDIQDLREILAGDLEELRNWEELSPAEAKALNGRSAAVAASKLGRVINEARSFYTRAIGEPSDIYDMVGEKGDNKGRLVIIDLQGLSDDARQIITALISSEIMRAAADKRRQTRPCFLVYEEGHNFAPAGIPCISKKIIKKIASEGRKFGVGFSIISQRPSKLDPDVTSQCNTIITMRLKNPDDQRFMAKTSDMFSKADIDELPSLSTGEALICGRSIPAPLLVKVGTKALIHGGESPEVLNEWGVFNG